MNKDQAQQLIDQIKTKLQMIWVNELHLPIEVQVRMMAMMDREIENSDFAFRVTYTQKSIDRRIDHLSTYCVNCDLDNREFYQYPSNSDSEFYICMSCEIRAIKVIPVKGEIVQDSENYGKITYGNLTWSAYRPHECLRCKKPIEEPYRCILLKYSSRIAWVLCTTCEVLYHDFLSSSSTDSIFKEAGS